MGCVMDDRKFKKGTIVKIYPCKSTGQRVEYSTASRSEFMTKLGPFVKVDGINKALPMYLVEVVR